MARFAILSAVLLLSTGTLSGSGPSAPSIAQEPQPKDLLTGPWTVLSESYANGPGHLRTTTVDDLDWYDHEWTFAAPKAHVYCFHRDGSEYRNSVAHRFDGTRDPMWLDLVGAKEVELGRVQIVGGRMTWVRGPSVPLAQWQEAAGHLSARPRVFEVKKDGGGRALLVLKRGHMRMHHDDIVAVERTFILARPSPRAGLPGASPATCGPIRLASAGEDLRHETDELVTVLEGEMEFEIPAAWNIQRPVRNPSGRRALSAEKHRQDHGPLAVRVQASWLALGPLAPGSPLAAST